jgi:hypothetical protein
MTTRASSWVCIAVLVFVGLSIAVTGSAAAQSADLVVAADGTGDHTSIQHAVDNATAGDRIKVESGTYEQHTEVSKNITVYAPNGATIANTSTVASDYGRADSRSGFQISRDVTPTISGFTLTDWQWAVSAGGSENAWTVKDMEIVGGSCGICAAGTPGDWSVRNTTVRDAGTISAYKSTGDWEIVDTTISGTDISADESTGTGTIQNTSLRDAPSDAVKIEEATGVLTIRESLIANTTYAAIEAENTSADLVVSDTVITTAATGLDLEKGSTGDLELRATRMDNITYDAIDVQRAEGTITVEDTTVRTASNGIDAEKSDGPLTITNLTVRDTSGDGIDASNATGDSTVRDSAFRDMGDKSIDLIDSEGKWDIHESILTGGREGGVDAWDANLTVNASYNYWGAVDGPSGQFNGSGSEAGGNLAVTPYYTDASLTTLEDGTGGLNVSVSPAEVTATEIPAITVSVVEESGAPVPGATVEIDALGLSATTDDSGEASLSPSDPAPGEYTVSVSAAGFDGTNATLTVGGAGAIPEDAVYAPDSAAVEVDADSNGRIDITELGTAASEYANGDRDITDLGEIASAYANS